MSAQSDIHPSILIFWSFALPLLPILVGTLTSSIKVSLVLGMLRNSFGVQGVPGKMVEFAISLGITIFVMTPVFHEMQRLPEWTVLSSTSTNSVTFSQVDKLSIPWRNFLFRNTGIREFSFVKSLRKKNSEELVEKGTTGGEKQQLNDEPSNLAIDVLVPSFILSELNGGFKMGFSILLPFLVLDLIVANLLIGLGLSMVSPTLMAFPLKVILFIAVDGWMLVTKGLILSYS